MGEELTGKFNARVELVAGSGGVFDVQVDGRRIFSKALTGRFPKEGEIEQLVRAG